MKVRLGIIGTGHLGKYHIECAKRIEECELIGFFDTNPQVAETISEKYEIPSFGSIESLLESCDAVCIVTPTSSHATLTKKAIDFGIHVFVEKPLTDSPDTSEELVALIESSGLIGRVGHVERYSPAFIAAQHSGIRSPKFIEAHRLAPFNIRGTDVSVVMDLMIHDIDLILHMVDSPVDHIEANGVGVAGPTADICNARITFKNKAVANLTASRISLKQMRKLRLFQSEQYMAIDFLNHEVQVVQLFENEPDDRLSMKIDMEAGERWIAADNPEIVKHNAIEAELRDFVNAIIGNTSVGVTFRDGMKAVQVAFGIIHKMNENGL